MILCAESKSECQDPPSRISLDAEEELNEDGNDLMEIDAADLEERSVTEVEMGK